MTEQKSFSISLALLFKLATLPFISYRLVLFHSGKYLVCGGRGYVWGRTEWKRQEYALGAPKPVQQNRQFTGHRYDGSLFGCAAASFG